MTTDLKHQYHSMRAATQTHLCLGAVPRLRVLFRAGPPERLSDYIAIGSRPAWQRESAIQYQILFFYRLIPSVRQAREDSLGPGVTGDNAVDLRGYYVVERF